MKTPNFTVEQVAEAMADAFRFPRDVLGVQFSPAAIHIAFQVDLPPGHDVAELEVSEFTQEASNAPPTTVFTFITPNSEVYVRIDPISTTLSPRELAALARNSIDSIVGRLCPEDEGHHHH